MHPTPSNHLVYAGQAIHVRDEMLSLTDMWRAAGSPSGRAPSDWLDLVTTKEFVGCVEASLNAGISGIKARRGRQGGVDAQWQIGLAYAKYLSPEFRMWCNTVVRERMEAVHAHGPRAATTRTRPQLTYKEEMAALRRVREARLAFGSRAAQRAWIDSGLPIVDGMLPPDQGEMSLTPPAGGRH